jgi:hypothetical protein
VANGRKTSTPNVYVAHQDLMEHHEHLLHRAARQLALAQQPLPVHVDPLGRDLLERRRLAELCHQRPAHIPVVRLRRGGQLLVVAAVALVLRARVLERLAGARLGASQRAAPSVGQQLLQRLVRGAVGLVAGGWAAALGPPRAEPLLDLAAVGQAVLQVQDLAALALLDPHVSGD